MVRYLPNYNIVYITAKLDSRINLRVGGFENGSVKEIISFQSLSSSSCTKFKSKANFEKY